MASDIPSLSTLSPNQMPEHLAIGMFDGAHKGHQAVLNTALNTATQDCTSMGVLTFDPHPSALLRPQSPTKLIMDVPTKIAKLRDLGAQCVICEPFTNELAHMEAEAFLPFLKKYIPDLKAIYVGENFRFGNMRSGNPQKMKAWEFDFKLFLV